MFMHDFNRDQTEVILMIHPMLSDGTAMYEMLKNTAGNGYRYLCPDLSAHGNASDRIYHNAAEEAEQIHDYLIVHGLTDIRLGYCASLGGCVLLELLRYTDLHFHRLFFEGISMYMNAKIPFYFSKTLFLRMHRKAAKNPEIADKTLVKMYGEEAGKAMTQSLAKMDEESIVNICSDCSFVKLPVLNPKVQKRCVFAYGTKEFDYKNAKKVQPVMYPEAEFKVWQGRDHCERLVWDTERYAEMLTKYL